MPGPKAKKLLQTSRKLNQMKDEIETILNILRRAVRRANKSTDPPAPVFTEVKINLWKDENEEYGALVIKCLSTTEIVVVLEEGCLTDGMLTTEPSRIRIDNASGLSAENTAAIHAKLDAIIECTALKDIRILRDLESFCSLA